MKLSTISPIQSHFFLLNFLKITHTAFPLTQQIMWYCTYFYLALLCVFCLLWKGLRSFKVCAHGIRDVVGAQEIIIKWVNWLILHRPFFYISFFLIGTSYTVISCSFHGWLWCHFLLLCLLLSWKCCGKKIIPSPYSFSFTLFTLAPLIYLRLIMLVE